METKAYFASSLPAALEVARQELGENALLVSSRPALPETRQFGRLEVTFAFDPVEPKPRLEVARPEISASPVSAKRASALHPQSDMAEIRQQLAALRTALGRGGQTIAPIEPEDGVIAAKLVAAGLSQSTASDLALAALRRPGDRDTAVLNELASRIKVAPFVEMKAGESRTVAFIGPSGRGKTSSLVKIATKLGLARHVPVRIFCAGAHCIGASEQLARFASILGTPFQAFESLASLNLALNGEGWKGLTLIDTPGISPADRTELAELKSFFSVRPEIEKHLVLRADANSADTANVLSRFSGLSPSRLLITGMDETLRVASVVEALVRGDVPATFCGTGQRIPEDLEEMSVDRLARAVWTADFAASSGKFAQAAA